MKKKKNHHDLQKSLKYVHRLSKKLLSKIIYQKNIKNAKQIQNLGTELRASLEISCNTRHT